jgi:hypothetical protein
MQTKTNEGKTMPIKSDVNAETSLPTAEIPFSPWYYQMLNFHYHT